MTSAPAASRSTGRRARLLAVIAAVTAVAIAVSVGAFLMRRNAPLDTASPTDPTTAPQQCDAPTPVRMVVTPEVQQVVKSLTQDVTPSTETGCVQVRVEDGAPTAVLAELAAGASTAPDVWIPDSSLWLTQALAKGAAVTSAGSFGASPVVLATTAAAADAAGWIAAPPSWPAALTSGRPLAIPDPRDHAPSLLALATARSEAAADPVAVRKLTVSTALSQQRAGVTSTAQSMSALTPSDPAAPLVITGHADLQRSMGEDSGLVEITPAGGVPVLDYPVVVLARDRSEQVQAGIDAFVASLLSPEGQAAAAAQGLGPPAPASASAAMAPEELTGLVTELAILSRPSQILVVVDVSTSMLAEAAPGVSRADIAAQALAGALPLLPDTTRVGLWLFASRLDGELDYRVVAPVQPLDAPAGGTTQRELLSGAVASLPGSLQPGGTSLYDVTLDALRSAQQSWDPEVVTTVVLITDGKNEDSTGYTLDQLNAEIQAAANPERPLGLIAVAFGPDSDLAALESITAAAQSWGPSQAVDAREPSALASLVVASLGARIDLAAAQN